MNIPNAFAETLKDTLEEIGKDQIEVSRETGIPASHLSAMKHGHRRVTPEYDLRLSRYFGTSQGFWLRLQIAYDMRVIREKKGDKIHKEVPVFA